MSKQQIEALEYFDSHARYWFDNNVELDEKQVNVMRQRNDYVLQIAADCGDVKSLLDLGCGAGQLVCAAAKMNIESTGIDFSKNMINLAIQNAKYNGVEHVNFICGSIFDHCLKKNAYDLISGNGLIEYMSLAELKMLLTLTYKALRHNGKLILASRNRLFSLFSLNKFTLLEIENRRMERLVMEAVDLANAKSVDSFSETQFDFYDDEYPTPKTVGVDVEIRK